MIKIRLSIFIQAMVLLAFCTMAAASASTKSASGSGIDWRGAAVGASAGYNGYVIIGSASSQSQAANIAKNKGYSEYIWDSVNGNVYAK